MSEIKIFFILTNSPGEVAGWVAPVVAEIRRQLPSARVEIFLTPCQFQSGSEKKFVEEFLKVERVWDTRQSLKLLFQGFSPELKKEKGAVILLGGDHYYGKRFSESLCWPLFTYTQTRAKYLKATRAYFVPEESFQQRFSQIPAEKIIVTGDLTVDAVKISRGPAEIRSDFEIDPNKFTLTFMPSSRPAMFLKLVPFYLGVIEHLARQKNEFQLVFNISDFISEEQLRQTLTGYKTEKKNPNLWILFYKNLSIKIIQKSVYEVLSISDFLVTIPGTNTLQAAFLGLPMLVLVPTNYPELLQFEGLLGILGNLPVFGIWLKKLAIAFLGRQKIFFGQPNIRAKKYLVPEMSGFLNPERVAEKILASARDKNYLKKVSLELKEITGPPGAAHKLVQKMIELSRDL